MNIAVDLRGLNYQHITGVNTYTLHFLKQLSYLKNHNLNITGIGLKEQRKSELAASYPFLVDLFDEFIDLPTYFGMWGFLKNQKFLSLILVLQIIFTKRIFSRKAKKFDFIFLPQPKPFLINPSSKLIVVFHDLFGVIGTGTTTFRQRFVENKFLYKKLTNGSYKIITNSLSTSNDVVQYLNIDKSKVLLTYPAIPFIKASKPLQKKSKNISIKGKYIVSVSGIEPRKNWINLIKAHHYLNNKYSDYNLKLVLIGRVVNLNYYKKLLDLQRKLNIKNIEFLIDLDDLQKELIIENSLFTVYSSFWEGFGFPILESLKHKKAIVTSKISSMPELAKDSGVYVNPFNYKEIASGIYILFKDKEFRMRLEKQTKKNLEYFSWDELRERLDKIIN